MKINTVLYTRNGRVIGNAIVVGHEKPRAGISYYKVKTDYGNETVLSAGEIDSMFSVHGYYAKVDPSHKHAVANHKQDLFNYMQNELGAVSVDNQMMDDILDLAKKILANDHK